MCFQHTRGTPHMPLRDESCFPASSMACVWLGWTLNRPHGWELSAAAKHLGGLCICARAVRAPWPCVQPRASQTLTLLLDVHGVTTLTGCGAVVGRRNDPLRIVS
jgi:hypothetical protein